MHMVFSTNPHTHKVKVSTPFGLDGAGDATNLKGANEGELQAGVLQWSALYK